MKLKTKTARKVAAKSATRKATAAKSVTLKGTVLPSVDKNFVIVRMGPAVKAETKVRAGEDARTMLLKMAKAIEKPGIRRDVVFPDSNPRAYAYYIDAKDPTRIVRESRDGTRKVGRLVQGRFRAA